MTRRELDADARCSGDHVLVGHHEPMRIDDDPGTKRGPAALVFVAEPGIAIELVASNQLSNLLRREADIAVRHVRPEQQVGRAAFGFAIACLRMVLRYVPPR